MGRWSCGSEPALCDVHVEARARCCSDLRTPGRMMRVFWPAGFATTNFSTRSDDAADTVVLMSAHMCMLRGVLDERRRSKWKPWSRVRSK
jgi:hypothetical protein